MRLIRIFVSLFLCWVAYDLNLFRFQRREFWYSSGAAVSLTHFEGEFEEEREVKRHERGVIPESFKGLKLRDYVHERCNYFSVRARDARYSDQCKIRRRCINS